MRKDNNSDFDLRMRSILEDAQETAPEQAWDNISARLDAASAPVGTGSRAWRWAVPSLAIAAALAALLIVGRPSVKVSEPAAAPESQLMAEAATPESPETVANIDAAPARHRTMPAKESAATAIAETAPEIQPAIEAGSAEPELAVEPEITAATDEKQPEAAAAEAKAADKPEVTDPFSAMAAEDAKVELKKGNRPKIASLEVKGALASNDSQFGSRNFSNQMAPGSGSGNAGIKETSTSVYGIPFSAGLGVRFNLGKKFSLGTGINYSLLTRSFTGTYTPDGGLAGSGDIDHTMHYLGIPVNFYYDIFSGKLVKFYAGIGGEAEYCVSSKYRPRFLQGTVISEKVNGLQYSAGINLGVEFRINDLLGIYFDPSVRYYFNTNQPKSIRTDRPLMINLEAGLRFNL